MWNNRENKIILHTNESNLENQIMADRNLVYIGSQSFEEVATGYPCKITRLTEEYYRNSFGFGFSSNSSLKRLFDFKFALYRSFGFKHYLRMRTKKDSMYGCGEEEEFWHSLDFTNIFVPFLIFGIGTFLAVICFLSEKIRFYH